MNRKETINQLVEETINSVDNINRATPMPFLLTRVKARINKTTENIWEKAGLFIGRPSIAIPGLMLLICINVLAILFNSTDAITPTSEQIYQGNTDEFSFAVSAIYDIENIEP